MRMKKEQTIDTSEYRYTLLVGDGAYFAQSIWSLIMEVLNHRFWHWKRGDGWMD